MRARDMVPHNYALRLSRGILNVIELTLYYSPKYHKFGASEICCCLFKSCLMNKDSTHIGEIDMNTISCVCVCSDVHLRAFEC